MVLQEDIHSVVLPSLHSAQKIVINPKEKSCTHCPSLGDHQSTFSMCLPILDILCKQNHITCDILELASFTQDVSKVNPYCSGSQCSLLFYSQVIFHSIETHYLSNHQRMAIWAIFTIVNKSALNICECVSVNICLHFFCVYIQG